MKAPIQILVLALVGTILFSGCLDAPLLTFDKCTSDCILIEGGTAYKQTGEPLANAELCVFIDRTGITSGLDPNDNIGSTFTDANGNYSFDIPWSSLQQNCASEVRLHLPDDVVPDANNTVTVPLREEDIGVVIDTQLEPYIPGTLIVKFVPRSPSNSLHTIRIVVSYDDDTYQSDKSSFNEEMAGQEFFRDVLLPLGIKSTITVTIKTRGESEREVIITVPQPTEQNNTQIVVY